MSPAVVVDASAGAKWFKDEAGSEEAYGLLVSHASGEIDIHMPEHCVGELLAMCARWEPAPTSMEAWVQLDLAGIETHSLGDRLVREAEAQMQALGCALYDALAPALAVLLDATLCSADAKAHSSFPGVRLLGSAGREE